MFIETIFLSLSEFDASVIFKIVFILWFFLWYLQSTSSVRQTASYPFPFGKFQKITEASHRWSQAVVQF